MYQIVISSNTLFLTNGNFLNTLNFEIELCEVHLIISNVIKSCPAILYVDIMFSLFLHVKIVFYFTRDVKNCRKLLTDFRFKLFFLHSYTHLLISLQLSKSILDVYPYLAKTNYNGTVYVPWANTSRLDWLWNSQMISKPQK